MEAASWYVLTQVDDVRTVRLVAVHLCKSLVMLRKVQDMLMVYVVVWFAWSKQLFGFMIWLPTWSASWTRFWGQYPSLWTNVSWKIVCTYLYQEWPKICGLESETLTNAKLLSPSEKQQVIDSPRGHCSGRHRLSRWICRLVGRCWKGCLTHLPTDLKISPSKLSDLSFKLSMDPHTTYRFRHLG